MIDNKQISKKGISSIKFNLKLKDEFFLRKHILNEK
jgi:hypothetical protein